ncbi:hypothetical protein [Microscilla marina]|uniref:Uncharacterized protein n=1 Tax=Microscilla marina ATCC 23134 TaxID=313606 RepID=A1ZX65_MICM2|nr:hypothetical protein [Microscilla marina]EAY25046.1 hypothetical protein M23134_07235 [Microscilla marina ATCC 23134]
MFNFFQKKTLVSDVRVGRHLETAEENTVQEFFQRRMENRLKKVLGYNWEIYFRTDEWLYYGYTKGNKKPKQFVEQLYKVKRTPLEKDFPGFAAVTGQQVRKTIGQTLQKKFPLGEYTTLVQNMDWKAKLEEDTIQVDVTWTYSTDGTTETCRTFEMCLDKNHLTLVSLDEVSPSAE